MAQLMPAVAFFLLCTCVAVPAHADWFYRFVGFECDTQKDRLVVHHKGAFNDAGKSFRDALGRTEWEPDSLVEWDGDRLKRTRTVERSCKLRHATYRVLIGPKPGNANLQRRCGAVVSAWVKVWRGGRLVLPQYTMEGDCFSGAAVTTTIVFASRGNPVFIEVPADEFLK